LSTLCKFCIFANKCFAVLQSVKKSVTLEARFGEKGKLQ
jgi:hypothetical protein